MSPNPHAQAIERAIDAAVSQEIVDRLLDSVRRMGTNLIDLELLADTRRDAEEMVVVARRVTSLSSRLEQFEPAAFGEAPVFVHALQLVSLATSAKDAMLAPPPTNPKEVRQAAANGLAGLRALSRQLRRLILSLEQTVSFEVGEIDPSDAALIAEGDRFAVH